jgi:predicted nucleotidyltransferase component of viral defense system
MIGAADVRELARAQALRDTVVEKDYVLGWLLWALGNEPALAGSWAFKGGTCLRKCYFGEYRFSEDLDFTVTDSAAFSAAHLRERLAAVADRLYEASGIEVPLEHIRVESYVTRRGHPATEVRLSYRGPLAPRGDLPRVRLDLTLDEVVVQRPTLRSVAHPYPDRLPGAARARSYSLAEILGEKLRALGDRCLPRDLYDVVNIHRKAGVSLLAAEVLEILRAKCAHKALAVPTLASVQLDVSRGEIHAEWENMLRYQVPALPPADQFVAELPGLFAWLHTAS